MRLLCCIAFALTACRTQPLPFVDATHGDLASVGNGHDLGNIDLATTSPDLTPSITTIHVDQSHVGTAGELSDLSQHNVQTFTVGVDGTLVGIECLFTQNGSAPSGTITLDVSNNTTLVKLGAAQLDAAAAVTSNLTLQVDTIGSGYFTFSPGIPVAAGQKLRFGISGPTLFVGYGLAPFEGGTDYPGGESYSDSNTLGRDLLFKTFVAY